MKRFLVLSLSLIISACTNVAPKKPTAASAPNFQEFIEYLANDNTPRKAKLKTIVVPIKNPVTWLVYNPDGTIPEVGEIYIRATDQSVRRVWVDCDYNGNNVQCKFVNSAENGSDKRDEQDDIWFLDRNNNPFRVTIPVIYGNYPNYTARFSIG